MRRRIGQVIAPLLIVHRVASKSALTSTAIVSGNVGLFKNGGRGKFTGDSGVLPGGSPMRSGMDWGGMNSGELEVWVETTVDFHWEKV